MEMTSASGPLSGVRVCDMTRNFAGPYGTLILADLGADVIKIEDPRRGDETRHMPPFLDTGLSTTFASLNRNKRSTALDLRDPKDRERAQRLAASCDVFIENLKPGKAEGLGLGWDILRSLRPNLVYCSISAFARVGPRGDDPGYDAMIQAYSGLMDLTGPIDGPPSRVGTGIIDLGTGMWAALNVIAALMRTRQTGEGVLVNSSLVETAAAMMPHHITSARHAGERPTRTGTAQHNMAPYEALQARDGAVLVGAASPDLFRLLCQTLDLPELVEDSRFVDMRDRVANRRELVRLLEQKTRKYGALELETVLHDAGVPVSRIRPVHEFATDPQLDAVDFWGSVPGSEIDLPVMPFHLGGWRPQIQRPVPELGEHTDEVFAVLDASEPASL